MVSARGFFVTCECQLLVYVRSCSADPWLSFGRVNAAFRASSDRLNRIARVQMRPAQQVLERRVHAALGRFVLRMA